MHDHSKHDHHSHLDVSQSEPNPKKALVTALLVTLVFMGIEVSGGIWSKSLALLSDAIHMLNDAGALLLSLFLIWVSSLPKSPKMSFGYHRAEIIGALLSGLAIWILAGWLIYEAVLRVNHPPEIRGNIVVYIGAIGLLANLFCIKILHSSKDSSLNLKAAYLHMFSDLVGSVGAVASGLAIWFWHLLVADLIITFGISLLMVFSSWDLIKESVQILMESTPEGLDSAEVKKALESVSGVIEIHDLHIWSVSGSRKALSAHIISSSPSHEIIQRANTLLDQTFNIVHTTIQVEDPKLFLRERCYDCATDGHLVQKVST